MGLAGGWLRADLTPLRDSRDFRLLYSSRTVTLLGSLAAEVAMLVQARDLTGSAFAVGLLGAVELVPLVIFGLVGGSIADRVDRGRVLLWCEAALGLCTGGLLVNALLPRPALWPLYVVAGLASAAGGLQRPSFDAAVPRLVRRDQLTAAIALLAASGNTGQIAGSAIGGVLAAGPGPAVVYGLDTASFAISLVFLGLLRAIPVPAGTEHAPRPGLRGLLDGVRYAVRRQDLVGSYLADLAAMGFAYPNALFPFLAAELHASWSVGLMFAAPPAGALAASVLSGWAGRVHRHGLAIALAAAAWGTAIAALGLAPDVAVALACLLVAGAADMISGLFRQTLWTQTIPDELRGRMAGVEMLSYSVGPTVGQLRAGAVAAVTSARVSLWSGGLACVGTVGLVCLALPGFRAYSARRAVAETTAVG